MEMVRVNSRLSYDANLWLDNESKRSGVPKSTLILLAVENYIREKEALKSMADIGQLVSKIEQLEKSIERKGLE